MTVQDLINSLQQEDPQANVHIAYKYGDHWNTTVAPSVREVQECAVKRSEYHQMDKLADYDDEGTTRAVVISSTYLEV